MAKIIGVQKSVGDFNGHPYSNYRITCSEEYAETAKDCYGSTAKVYTGKTELLDKWMANNNLDPKSLIGLNVEMYFDPNGKISLIQLA